MPKISRPLAIRRRCIATMSACSVEPVNQEINPATQGCCIGETSCNALVADWGLTDWGGVSWVVETSCNATEVLGRGLRQ
jgi:hypothetical protein